MGHDSSILLGSRDLQRPGRVRIRIRIRIRITIRVTIRVRIRLRVGVRVRVRACKAQLSGMQFNGTRLLSSTHTCMAQLSGMQFNKGGWNLGLGLELG